MSRDHVKELIMGSPHVEEFEVPPTLNRMIQTNFGRRVVCKSFRRIKVKISQELKGRPIWICHNPIKFAPQYHWSNCSDNQYSSHPGGQGLSNTDENQKFHRKKQAHHCACLQKKEQS